MRGYFKNLSLGGEEVKVGSGPEMKSYQETDRP